MFRNRYLTRQFGIIVNYSEESSCNFKRKSFHLQNYKSLLKSLQLIPKNFKITTQNGSSKFNIDILKLASPVILQFTQSTSEKSEYHLFLNDNQNVLSKLEQLYQGNPVIIENDEIQPFQQIAQNLKIQLNKPYTGFNQHMKYKPTKAIIDLASLIDLLKSNTTFTIKTKSKEYKCNRIGINLSTKISEFLVSNPTADNYSYDFQDEFDEFQLICDFFNFKTFSVTTDNMDSIRKIAEELQINFLLNETGDFFDKYDKFYEIIDEQQESIDEIDELFDLLTNIEYKTVKFVKESIFQSKWSKKEEDVQELGAFILQVIDSNMILHRYLIDLLIQLNSESTEQSKLKILLTLIVDNLMDSFGTNIQNCSFIYLLYKKEIISKQDLLKSIYNKSFSYEIDVNRLNQINDTNENNNPNINDGPLYNYGSTVNKGKKIEVELIKVNTPILLWFLPEIIEINNLTSTDKLRGYGTVVDSFIKKYFDQIDLYKKMRDNGEPNDELTMALRHDDVDKFQSIISVSRSNIENGIVPYNIYEEFVPNGKTKYLNYASAYGSIKCFKYLLLNHIQVDKQTFKFAVYGGNIEIIKIVDQKYQDDDILNKNDDDDRQRNDRTRFFQSYNKCLFIRTKSYFSIDKNLISEFMNKVVLDKRFTYSIVPSIVRHQNDLFDWVLEKNVAMKSIDKDSFTDLIIISYESGNVHSLIELFDRYFKYIKEILAVNEKETSLISDMIQTICQNGFYLLTKIILKAFESILPNDQQDILVPAFNNRKGFYFNNSNLYDPLKIYPPRKKNDSINVISFGNLSILKLFIPKYDQYTLESILLYAILNNNLNVVTYFFDDLVKKNVFQITKDNYEYFILYSLFQKSDYLFNYLIEKIKEIDSSFVVKWSISLVKNATFSNNVQLSKYISDIVFKESPKEDFFIPFMNAVSSNSVELCKYFIDKKVFISFKKLKNHVISISKANKEIFSILMNVIPQEKMKKINEHIYVNAITHNNVDVVEIILKTIPSINHGLFEAVENSNLEIVKLILKNNSSPKFVNKRTPKGSPLNFAVHNNNLEIVKELLSVPGIDASLCDKSGNTPLIEAFNNKNIDILNSILDFYGNDIQCQSWQLDFLVQKISQNMNKTAYNNVIDRILDIKGIYMHPTNGLSNYEHINSLLLNACMKNDVNFVSKLLSLDKIDVNMYQPVTGNTVLIEAILNDNIEIANLLIKYPKTNINFRNNSDQTPLTIAVQNNMNSIIELLLNDENFDKDDSLFNYAFSISTGETTKIFLNSKYLDINDKIYTIQNQPFEIKKRKKWESKIYRLNNDTLLIDAAKNQNEYLIDLIINHPSFDKKKSKLNDAIFASLENPRDTNIFKKLIGIVDIDKFNKYQNDNKGLLHNIVSPQAWGNTNINKIASEFLTIALENSNFVFSKTDLNSTFRSIFRELRITNSSKTFFTTNNLEKLITYDRSHNNYIDINCNDNDKTYFTTLDYDTNKDLILKLIEFGADPNIPDGYGILPLQYSFYIGTSECIRIFIQSNKIDYNKRILDVKMNMKNSNSSYYSSNLYKYYSTNKYTAQKQIKNHITYLHLAARYYDPEILKIFLDDKLIDVNVTDDLGNTPLIDACKFNRGNNVELLFQIDNLDFLHCNKEGKDALHILDTSLPDDDRTIKDKNEYLKKLMTLLDRDKNNPKDKSNSNVWGKKPEFKFQTITWYDKANTSINSKYTKKMSWAAKSNSSKTNINTPSNPPDLIKTPDLSNETSTSISFNQENKPKQSWGMKSNSSAKKNWPQKPAFSKTSKPPDLIKISDSSDKTSESESSFGIKSTSSDQTNPFKSSDSLITSNKQIQLNHASLMDDESPKKKQFSNSIDQSHELLSKINHIDDEKFEEPSSNEENINSQMHSKMMERSCTQLSDIESQILLEYPMTNEDQRNPQYLINNQSLIAQQQMNQMLYINQINQMQFYQQMMMQANFLNSLKHHKSKRKKKSKH